MSCNVRGYLARREVESSLSHVRSPARIPLDSRVPRNRRTIAVMAYRDDITAAEEKVRIEEEKVREARAELARLKGDEPPKPPFWTATLEKARARRTFAMSNNVWTVYAEPPGGFKVVDLVGAPPMLVVFIVALAGDFAMLPLKLLLDVYRRGRGSRGPRG
jgi:hypothetical protein